MNATSVKLYNFDLSDSRTYLFTALFVIGNLALPQLCHLVPNGGHILLPIYFFIRIPINNLQGNQRDIPIYADNADLVIADCTDRSCNMCSVAGRIVVCNVVIVVP